nr:TIR domain-containing protein [Leptolyngbya sp. CCY15150]
MFLPPSSQEKPRIVNTVINRRVFFSFHYQRDIWRVNVVRNHAKVKSGYQEAGYWDCSLWESTKRTGEISLKRLIDSGLQNTSVTVVLIGTETSERQWVNYEIEESYNRGNGMLGIYIHNIKNITGRTDLRGKNPFDSFIVEQPSRFAYMSKPQIRMSQIYPTYDWVNDGGYNNFSKWVEDAARAAGR